ncbi:MAG: class I SAM-dependent methyltransferase [Candidatus Levybacteria bacterium]|nr:class I SAM-dependent methyltransferase [Candidatus Levybacteria bacterium]
MYLSNKFYTQFAESYAQYASTKEAYLSAVNNFIKEETDIVKTMIDVGSGDGKRGKLISNFFNIKNFVILDSSEGMIDMAKNITNALVIKADISSNEFKLENKYDVVLCLWNVLGHIAVGNRKIALKNLSSLVENNGVVFLDVNNRYNVVHYGIRSVIKNLFKDVFLPKKTNGDFSLKIDVKGTQINTIVHIFNPFEIERLFKSAGFLVLKRKIIDYKTGEIKNNLWEGQLVYKLKKI